MTWIFSNTNKSYTVGYSQKQTKAVGIQNVHIVFDMLWCVGHITPSALSFTVTLPNAHRLTWHSRGSVMPSQYFPWSQTHWRIFVKWHQRITQNEMFCTWVLKWYNLNYVHCKHRSGKIQAFLWITGICYLAYVKICTHFDISGLEKWKYKIMLSS